MAIYQKIIDHLDATLEGKTFDNLQNISERDNHFILEGLKIARHSVRTMELLAEMDETDDLEFIKKEIAKLESDPMCDIYGATTTNRGFHVLHGEDDYGTPYKFQESSSALESKIWFGAQENPLLLTQEQAGKLVPTLQYFAEHGELPMPSVEVERDPEEE